MDNAHEPTVNLDDLKRWARIAKRFQPGVAVTIAMDPAARVMIGDREIRNLKQWHEYWNEEIFRNHWDPKIGALASVEKPQSIKDLIRRLENKKKNPGEE